MFCVFSFSQMKIQTNLLIDWFTRSSLLHVSFPLMLRISFGWLVSLALSLTQADGAEHVLPEAHLRLPSMPRSQLVPDPVRRDHHCSYRTVSEEHIWDFYLVQNIPQCHLQLIQMLLKNIYFIDKINKRKQK